MALSACGLARALEEKTRCIEWVCIYAFTYTHTYTMTSMYYSLKLQFSRPAGSMAMQICRGATLTRCAGLRGRLHITRRRHKSVSFAGISHIGIELDRYTTLHDGLHKVIDTCRAKLSSIGS